MALNFQLKAVWLLSSEVWKANCNKVLASIKQLRRSMKLSTFDLQNKFIILISTCMISTYSFANTPDARSIQFGKAISKPESVVRHSSNVWILCKCCDSICLRYTYLIARLLLLILMFSLHWNLMALPNTTVNTDPLFPSRFPHSTNLNRKAPIIRSKFTRCSHLQQH